MSGRIRKKPKQKRSQDTFEAILQGADRSIHKNPAQLSTNQFAKLAGVSVGSLYQYFKNKDEVFTSLYQYLNRYTMDLLSKDAYQKDAPRDPKDLIEDGIDTLVDHFLKYDKHFRVFMKVVSRLNLFSLICTSRRRSARKVAEFLEEDLNMDKARSETLSFILTNAFLGCVHNHIMEDEKTLSTEELKRELKAMVFAVLAYEKVDLGLQE